MNYSVLRAEEQQPMFDVSSHPLCITLCVTERNQLVIKLACTLFYMSGYYCREWVIIWGHFLSLFRKDTFSTGICCCSLLDGIRTGPSAALLLTTGGDSGSTTWWTPL